MTQTRAVEQKIWTVLSLLNWSTDYFTEQQIESPRLNVELLLCYVLHCSRLDLYTHFDKPLLSDELAVFKSLLKRRMAHEPLQYIVNESEFMGLRFVVDRRVLIPRPETELLVEESIRLLQSDGKVKRILDIGTGSGNIAVCLAKYVHESVIDAIDVSATALEVAKINVERNEVGNNVRLKQHDFLSQGSSLGQRSYDMIVSNPPYISSEEYALVQPEVREFEPAIAATDNADGLTFYKAIAVSAKELLTANGWVVVEMAYNQSNDVKHIFDAAGYRNIDVVKDYAGIERILKAQV